MKKKACDKHEARNVEKTLKKYLEMHRNQLFDIEGVDTSSPTLVCPKCKDCGFPFTLEEVKETGMIESPKDMLAIVEMMISDFEPKKVKSIRKNIKHIRGNAKLRPDEPTKDRAPTANSGKKPKVKEDNKDKKDEGKIGSRSKFP